jgi:cell division protein FtsL
MGSTGMFIYRRRPQPRRLIRERYLRIFGVIILIIAVSSVYIYQRVWVRNLVVDIGKIEKRNEAAQDHLAKLEAEWLTASSIAKVEEFIEVNQLHLGPTKPAQNLALEAPPLPDTLMVAGRNADQSRFAGLTTAMDKLKSNLPAVEVKPNQLEAGQLFEKK